jgi:putative membrane-bound dehydrogenase-like protein
LPTRAAEPEVAAQDLPRIPAVEPKDAIATLKIRPGFRAEFAAHEPQVVSPVALAFDEDSRLYVVEMIDYSERRDEKLGRIRLLEDADGDGYYEKATVYAEGFGWPTGVFPWKGGVFVACTPDVLYLKDTDGDGKADQRTVVFTGFADGVKRLNVQALLNSFNWGLDNRIHGATSMNGGRVTGVGADGKPAGKALELRSRNFAIDPRTMRMTAENGGGQHGLSYDDYGRAYVTSNSRHIMSFAYDARYADRNPSLAMPSPLVDIPVDGPAAEVFRASPEEPWRVIRTKWRVSGISSGPIEGGGRSAGYFTGATGVTIYRGDAYGADFLNNAFIGDAGGNLVHRKVIRPDGVIVKAERAADEQKREFLASTDTWFRPVQFANGPDGCLYVIDMYRETIEHPWSLPESLKKHLDLNSGNDRGRLYRIVPADNFKRRAPVKLSKATTDELVDLLAHPNGWHRDTAARLLYERQDKAAVPALEKLLRAPNPTRGSALGRLHALYALDGLGALKIDHLVAATSDADEQVRAHALRLCERFLRDKNVPAVLPARLDALTTDPSPSVRYQLAFTLGYVSGDKLPSRLATIHAKSPSDPWVEAAVLNAIGHHPADLLKLLDTPDWRSTPTAAALTPKLAEQIGGSARGDEIAAVIELAERQKDDRRMMSLARSLGAGLRRAGLVIEAEKGDAILQRATALAKDASADPDTRASAVAVLGHTTWDHHAVDLLPLLDPRHGQVVQLAALAALDQLDRPGRDDLAPEILSRWPTLSPRLREAAAAVLIKRPARATALLEAIRAGKIARADLSGSQSAALRQSTDKAVKQLAAKVLTVPTGRRDEVVKAFQPALTLPGDARRGHATYLAKCASCHRLANEGAALGPDLETVKNTGREKLLTNILDPNREVAPQYTAYVVETTDGDSQIGVIAAETASTVTLKMAAGAQLMIPRADIKSLRSANLSMMPEGLEEGLKSQDLADLMEYIITGKP